MGTDTIRHIVGSARVFRSMSTVDFAASGQKKSGYDLLRPLVTLPISVNYRSVHFCQLLNIFLTILYSYYSSI